MKNLLLTLSLFIMVPTLAVELVQSKPSGICLNRWWNNLAITEAGKETVEFHNTWFKKEYTSYLGGFFSWETIGHLNMTGSRKNSDNYLKQKLAEADAVNTIDTESLQSLLAVSSKTRDFKGDRKMGAMYGNWLWDHYQKCKKPINVKKMREKIGVIMPPFGASSVLSEFLPIQTPPSFYDGLKEVASSDEERFDESENTASTSTDSSSSSSSGSSSPSPVRAASNGHYARKIYAPAKLEFSSAKDVQNAIDVAFQHKERRFVLRDLRAIKNACRRAISQQKDPKEREKLANCYTEIFGMEQSIEKEAIDSFVTKEEAKRLELEQAEAALGAEHPLQTNRVKDALNAPIIQTDASTSLESSVSYVKNPSFRMRLTSKELAMMSNCATSSSATINVSEVQEPAAAPSVSMYQSRNVAASPAVAAYLNKPTISEECRKKFATFINKGDEVLCKLRQGETPNATDRTQYLLNIIYLSWRLHAHAIEKGQDFTEGTFGLATEEGRKITDYLHGYVELVKDEKTSGISASIPWLAGNPFGYSRISSHYIYSEPEQFGIDIRWNANDNVCQDWLPENKTHILFGKDFIKLENHGMATVNDFAGHTGEWLYAQGRKGLPSLFGSDDQEGYRKERVPAIELKEFAKLLKDLKVADKEAQDYCANAKQHGIKDMYRIAKALYSISDEHAQRTIINPYLDRLKHTYDYLEQRQGNEVMLGYSLLSQSSDSQQQ